MKNSKTIDEIIKEHKLELDLLEKDRDKQCSLRYFYLIDRCFKCSMGDIFLIKEIHYQ